MPKARSRSVFCLIRNPEQAGAAGPLSALVKPLDKGKWALV
jgi:hypothetical protein